MSEWISVEDRLPKVGQKVFMLLKGDGNVGTFRDWRKDGGNAFFDTGDDLYTIPLEQVTHWLPLPPKEG